MTIRNAAPGVLLLRNGTLVYKTEYRKNDGDPECFCLVSGEAYCADMSADCINVNTEVVDTVLDIWEAP